ncbi:MAG: carbohydrate binding domain-containing protein [Planctomycetes bacterium]|nr:carbohydrate binding domain-containing protein [Planctomycetota bacterium]
MRNRAVWWMGALLIGCLASDLSQAQQVTNLIADRNPGFESGARTPWNLNAGGVATATVVKECVDAAVPERPIEGSYCLNVKLSGPSSPNWWNAAFDLSYPSFEKGKKYTLSLWIKSKSGEAKINFKPEHGADPWTGYGETQITANEKWAEYHVTTPVMTDAVTPASLTFHIGFAAQEFWVDDCKFYEGDYVPTVVKSKLGAYGPTPDDKATDIPRDPTLGWKAGPFANTHNVYLGAAFEDANTADLAQAAGKGQTGTTFAPTDLLEYGKTYYWRVDEVNAPPSTTVVKGDIWSFTVEPYAYPITGITATASSSDKTTTGPANTVNGSGLTNDLHSTSNDAMWMSSAAGPQPTWIQYQFNKVYKLYELWVWNHNTEFEPVLGYGCQDVAIEYSTDGTTWTLLKDVQLAQAPAAAGYAHNTTVDMGGVMARYVRLTANSNWSAVGLKQYGLSEVRFFYVPLEARGPQPAQYAEGVAVDGALDWRPGREATSHQVVFGTDKAAVADGTATSKTVTEHGFAPGDMDFGTMYYWKVDEVGATTYPGSIWSFTTQEFAAVDDFEAYTDNEGSRIYESWVDGWTNNSGSTVGYLQAPFAERSIIHGGKQAMPLAYDNTKSPYYSEAERTFDTPQDWTVSGADTLSLWFKGPAAGATPANDPAGLYVVVEDKAGKTKTAAHPDSKATTVSAWTEWRIPLSDLTGINLATVKKLTVGVGDKANPKAGGAGMVYVDDIAFGKPVVPIGLVASYSLENDVKDSSGNGHDGTVLGTVTYVDGPAGKGKAILFPGTPGNGVNLGTFNPSEKTGMLTVALWARWNGLSNQWQGLIGKRDSWANGETMWQIEANQTTGVLSLGNYNISVGSGNTVLKTGEWTHIAITFDKTTARFYVNGVQTASGVWSFGPDREAALQFGFDNAGGGNAFNGALDEIKLYDIALTPAEILALAGK